MYASAHDAKEITTALQSARQKTGAEIAVHILPYSQGYMGYWLIDSFLIASLVSFGVWWSQLSQNVYIIVLLQIAIIAALLLLPFTRAALVRILPAKVKHRHAARQAGHEYLHVLGHTLADRPVVLLFVSLAERYVHIMHSRDLHRTIDGQVWKNIVQDFTAAMPKQGLNAACLQAIDAMTQQLARHYPSD